MTTKTVTLTTVELTRLLTLAGGILNVEIEEPEADSVPGGACLSGDIPLAVITALKEV